MRQKLLIIAAGIVFAVATTAGAQEAIGPAAPRPSAREIDALEKTLQGLIKDNSAGKVWQGADAAKLAQFMERIESLKGDIHAIGIGPVTPRPASPPPPKPGITPPPKPPGPKPSQKSFEESLMELLDAVQDAKKRDPALTLPADDARDLRSVIDVLSKGQLR